MKRTILTMLCLAAMMVAGTSLKGQDITITLSPGWNWISYPHAVPMSIEDALAGFEPLDGDIIKGMDEYSIYNGGWGDTGDLETFIPGQGYKYYSSRTVATTFVFAKPYSSLVTTSQPTDITSVSAMVGGTVSLDADNHIFARGVCWGTEPNPDIDGNHIVGNAVAGSQSVTLEDLASGTTYYVRAYAVTDYGLAYGEELNFNTLDNHTYVDLGLPSGLLWATCNLGADNPEDYGDYFAWGETQSKDYYDWDTYNYGYDWDQLTKYCNNSDYGYNGFTDNLTTLLPEDDAATANWGDGWRMPTSEEWQELLNNTTVTWTTQNGVNGSLFTSTTNGNSLFLPAAGTRYKSNVGYYPGGYCYYWSSSLCTYSPSGAQDFTFYSNICQMSDIDRNGGLPVRAVRSSGQSNIPIGSINGKFTINTNGDQVYFSQGNLQYKASTNTWRFAEHQYDYVGSDNSDISSFYSSWIDLFGWGTSGWDSGNTYYQPWSTYNISSTLYGPPGSYNLTGSYANADWGVYNPISNGGNTANQWRTLSQPEWTYVFNTRNTTSGIRYAKANVNNVNGVILLPDDWNSSTYSLNNTNTTDASFSSNTISASQWNTLENAGAVFLPAAGIRNGTSVNIVGTSGRYWSASCDYNTGARDMFFNSSSLNPGSYSSRFFGYSVRVVCPAE